MSILAKIMLSASMIIDTDIYMVIKKKPAIISPYVEKTPKQNGWRCQYVSDFQCPA